MGLRGGKEDPARASNMCRTRQGRASRPTGCRAGMLGWQGAGRARAWSWPRASRVACVMRSRATALRRCGGLGTDAGDIPVRRTCRGESKAGTQRVPCAWQAPLVPYLCHTAVCGSGRGLGSVLQFGTYALEGSALGAAAAA